MRMQDLAKAIPMVSVSAVITLASSNVVLISRRLDNHYYSPGLWQFPGGMVDHGETPEAAVLREAREETGLRDLWRVPGSTVYVDSAVNSEGGHWICLFMCLRTNQGLLPANPEPEKHGDWGWHTTVPKPHMSGTEEALQFFMHGTCR